ncbi:PREDICTED: DNA repair protein RAD51 homolog 2 isoform X2 [Fragaria vesca subsp. vesca]|uniref:DNA repair protein RAD51 homolog 2 isoform X2 n=2 Tax=Fragaria vesca subsp. vesca TaxID=101020 RepID=UPI0002C373AE|nr:PREDICTED: DNA repair protein RAD51 homolog 2 isoform X2 [Fragaria vesca subsp. vesca]
MANMLINQMGLPKSIANVFAARNITTAKEALSLTEFELMELLDVSMAQVTSAIARISEITCPPYQTVLSLMEQRVQTEHMGGHLSTQLKGLDQALCGGIPFGVLTELVGPAGIGKTQFCLKLALLASLPVACGGLNGHVIYIDVESKFSSTRMIEIGAKSFPEIFHTKGLAQEIGGRIHVLRPTSLSEFTESLQQIKISLLQNQVKLLIIDSMAALAAGEHVHGATRQHLLGWHISFIKSLAEFSRIPVVVTNQVRSQSHDEICQYSFQAHSREKTVDDCTGHDSHLVAALGIHWAHAVTIRLVLDAKFGKRFIKLAKSPISPSLAFPFNITSSGISLLTDDGIELSGPEINTIHCQGHSGIINFDAERF